MQTSPLGIAKNEGTAVLMRYRANGVDQRNQRARFSAESGRVYTGSVNF